MTVFLLWWDNGEDYEDWREVLVGIFATLELLEIGRRIDEQRKLLHDFVYWDEIERLHPHATYRIEEHVVILG